ncbi:O-antigen ligase family protein [Adhaeribacter aquaticus]|uniref:O-antigen ligase family protein n=1 Tax=Adhaeribacter aquaticus TaxID=299567 RepID=UPI0004221ABC|nr:O-antigen ligase family protein [Adhaeribacter aquaticus]
MDFKTYINKAYFILLLVVAITLPLSNKINNVAVGLLVLYWLLSGNLYDKVKNALANKYFISVLALYLLQIIGLFYSTDTKYALNILEKKMGLVLLPLVILSAPKLTRQQVFNLIFLFAFSCLAVLGYAIYNVLTYTDGILEGTILTEKIDDFVNMHHAYSGMYLVFAIIGALFYLTNFWFETKVFYRSLIILAVFFLYVELVVLGARMALFVSFVLLGLQVIQYSIQRKNFKALAIVAGVGVLGVIGVLALPTTRTKLNEFIYLRGVHSPFTPRLIQWECCFDVIRNKNAVIWGVGTGDVAPNLVACYQDKKFWGALYNYNAHNEYLEEMVRHGVLGLLVFLVVLFYPLIIAWRQKNWLYVYFLLIFIVVCISETALSRQKGVIFYAFFNALLLSSFSYNKKENELATTV